MNRRNMTLDETITRRIDEIIIEKDFQANLNSGKKLRIKMGFDPTKADLHLGHMVGLGVLKKLQDAGHKVIFIIGDYTAKIGDPSGRNKTRPLLTDDEINHNAETYFSQVGQVLDLREVEIVANSTWLKKLNLGDLIDLTSKFSLSQIIEREDFTKRLKEKQSISLHEILYPVMQAYDSVMVKADVEFGGTDQKFNMLAGRALQKKLGQIPQDIVTIKLLVGTDGKNKMSKSLDNFIALNDSAKDFYGKIMSIPDDLIVEFFRLCTNVDNKAINIIQSELKEGSRNPREIKAELAKLITDAYKGSQQAEDAETEFNRVFKNKETPENIQEFALDITKSRLDDLLIAIKLATSKSEARRLIEQGAVEVSGNKITDPAKDILIDDGMIIQVGKRNFVKIKR